MLGFAARDVSIECMFLDPSEDPPAAAAGPVIRAEFDDQAALQKLAQACDVISYEFENVSVDCLRAIESICPVVPSPHALENAQDRLAEKRLFDSLQIPVAQYGKVDDSDDLKKCADVLGLPLVVKTRRFGYDGKGQAILRQIADADAVFESLGGAPLIAETMVPFQFEVSAIGARTDDGEIASYALTKNEHIDGILRVSRAPLDNPHLERLGVEYLTRLLERLDYVGVLALEMFVVGDKLLANEFAPRVHNSGHWTIEGCAGSQFENHLRAVAGMPLASTATKGYPGMVNIIGSLPSDGASISGTGSQTHIYGKQPRPGRKLGHITIIGETAEARDRRIHDIKLTL